MLYIFPFTAFTTFTAFDTWNLSTVSGVTPTIIVEIICKKHNVLDGVITVACDGLKYIRMEMDRETMFSSKSNNFDMLSAIKSKPEAYSIQYKWRHFKGNQDNDIRHLDIWATLNIVCDHASKNRWSTDHETRLVHNLTHKLKDEIWRLYINTPTDSTGNILSN